MNELNIQLNNSNSEADSGSSAYTLLFLLSGLAVATYSLARYAESQNKLDYDSRLMRIVAGFLLIMTNLLYSKKSDLVISTKNGALVASGPHQLGLVDALALASILDGPPPRFLATTKYNIIPLVESVLNAFKAILVAPPTTEDNKEKKPSANTNLLKDVAQVLKDKGCVALFPQGNFAKIGQEPHRIYDGVANMAIDNDMPVHVVRLDGFWGIHNSLVPLFIRNNPYYRSLISALHMHDIRPTLCCVIDLHLQPENKDLPRREKMDRICAILYAYYRQSNDLTKDQIKAIDVTSNQHLLIWQNKLKLVAAQKELVLLKKEETELTAAPSKAS